MKYPSLFSFLGKYKLKDTLDTTSDSLETTSDNVSDPDSELYPIHVIVYIY